MEGSNMKKELKKVSLFKETILRLTPMDLSHIRGKGWSDNSVCPTTTPTDCKPCSG
jgi:hypothetical protein